MPPTATVILNSGRDKSVRLRHPRLFSGAIKQIKGKAIDGDVVEVCSNTGEWLARGILNQRAQAAVRLLTWNEGEEIDEAFWGRQVQASVQRRDRDPLLIHTNARRLIFGESDGLPGVIADDYAGYVVVQISTMIAAHALPVIVEAIAQSVQPKGIVIRNDTERLRHEGVAIAEPEMARGRVPQAPVEIVEKGLHFLVNITTGQKTGFYLDQRENRSRMAHYCQHASVLNGFSFTGAFGIYAAAAGANRVVNLDSSAEVLKLAEQNVELNREGFNSCAQVEFVCGDAFADLRSRRDAGEQFDVVILDPPKFAPTAARVERATRAYKDLNRIGLLLVKPGGVLVTFSCSGTVDSALFQKVIFSAAIEANRNAQIIERLIQSSDHPVLLSFPESEYLKGLILRVE
jgi:23S rRNA (cytosine1962-C5)-methyltransferase